MQIKKLLILKNFTILLFVVCLHAPECHAKGGSIKKVKTLLGDVKKMFKCVVPIGKAFKAYSKNPKNGKKTMQKISDCMKSVKDLSKICDSSATLILTAVPEVGPQLSHGCGIAAKYEGKYDSIMEKIEQAETLAGIPGPGLMPGSKKRKISEDSVPEIAE